MATDHLVETVEKYLDTEARCERAWLTGHTAAAPCAQLDALTQDLRAQLALAKAHPRPAIARILVAVDKSPRAAWVLHTATHLAASLNAALRIVHVVDQSLAVNNEYGIADANVISALRNEGDRFLTTLTAGEPLAQDTVLREGDPGEEIVAAATAFGADLIVLAAPGHGQFVELLTGSAAEWAMRHAPCPVLTIAHDQPQKTPATTAPDPAI